MKRKSQAPKLWNDDFNHKKVAVINPGDFNILESLQKMKLIPNSLWSSLGICDASEIKERNAIMRFLFENPELRLDMTEILQFFAVSRSR